MSPKGPFVLLLLVGLLVAGCGKPRTEWRVTLGPVGICGMGIETERQAERAMKKSAENFLTSLLANERFWAEYVNADPTLPPLIFEELRITPRKIVDDEMVVLALSFIRRPLMDETAARVRIERAIKNLMKDRRLQEEQNALADLRARQAAATTKSDAASVELARQLERRIAEVEAQINKNAPNEAIHLMIAGA